MYIDLYPYLHTGKSVYPVSLPYLNALREFDPLLDLMAPVLINSNVINNLICFTGLMQ